MLSLNPKMRAGIEAAQLIEDGMIVGLGTGSTVFFLVEEVARRMNEEGLEITCVTTSDQTKEQAEQLGIEITDLDAVDSIDITIDGADEISNDFQGIKGGGAALLFEKIVATYSKRNVWIVDESKMVKKLGAFPLPVEVVPYGSGQLFKHFDNNNYSPAFRTTDRGKKLVTDGGHYIIDLHLKEIEHPDELARELSETVGVVEHGLFIDIVNEVIVGSADGIEKIKDIRN